MIKSKNIGVIQTWPTIWHNNTWTWCNEVLEIQGQKPVKWVDKYHRNKNIAPQIIQTHEYNQSHSNKKICVSLFKREEELTGIIPLTCYDTYCYNISDFTDLSNFTEPSIAFSNILPTFTTRLSKTKGFSLLLLVLKSLKPSLNLLSLCF